MEGRGRKGLEIRRGRGGKGRTRMGRERWKRKKEEWEGQGG